MSGDAFESRRVVRAYRQTIEAPPEVVFPLLCPVREAEWRPECVFARAAGYCG